MKVSRRQFLRVGGSVAAALLARQGRCLIPIGGANQVPTQAWTFQDLITGYTPFSNQPFMGGLANWGTQNDGGTTNIATWNPSGLGNFLRISGPGGTGVASGTFGLRYGMNVTGLHECTVQYSIRRFGLPCSKQLKVYGWGQINGGATSNSTVGCTTGGYTGDSYGIYYGDNVTGSNDATVAYLTSGYPTNNLPNIGFGDAFTRTPYPTQATTVGVTQSTNGTVFETYMSYMKASSPSTPDGEFALWQMISGVWHLVMHMTNLWNCSTTTQDRGGFGLFEFTSSSGFIEDYSGVYQMFARPVGMGI